MRKKPLKRKTPLKRTPIRRVSRKLSKELRRYYAIREQYLSEHPYCEVCADIESASANGIDFSKVRRSRDLHHKRGRGKYLNDTTTFCATCREHHDMIHQNPNWAREMGWLLT